MIAIRKSSERGHVQHDWLDTHHTFSFADYYDPEHMGYGPLQVINEDKIQPNTGFPMHGHQDMEIITYVLTGSLAHKDSMGNGSIIRPGDVQRMSAGTGVRHSEVNPSSSEPVHLLQIWIRPEQNGLAPSYEQKHFAPDERRNKWRIIASPDGRENSVTIHQNATILSALLEPGPSVRHALTPGRRIYLQIARGTATLNNQPLMAGDGAQIENEPEISVATEQTAELLLFDLPV